MPRRGSPMFRPPSDQEMLDMDLDSMTRRLLMQDAMVKQREKEIRAELKKGVAQAKKATKKKR